MRSLLAGVLLLLQAQAELKPGLIGEYYVIAEPMEDFPELGRKKPALRRIDATIDIPPADGRVQGTTLSWQFCIRWSGKVRIPKDGRYTFTTESDDGSRLYIDGKQIVDNGGLHAMEPKTGSVELKAGDHDLRVDYFNDGGGHGCRVWWESDDLPKAIIPAEALFHPKDKDLDKP